MVSKINLLTTTLLTLALVTGCTGGPSTESPQTGAQVTLALVETSPAPGLTEILPANEGEAAIYMHDSALATSDFASFARSRDDNGLRSISFEMNLEGAKKLARLTAEENHGKSLAFVVNGKALVVATIQSTMSTKAMLTGSFSEEEVTEFLTSVGAL